MFHARYLLSYHNHTLYYDAIYVTRYPFVKLNDLLIKEVLNPDNLKCTNTSLIVTIGIVVGSHVASFSFISELLIIDINDLLYIVHDNEEMKKKLTSFIDFDIDEIDLIEGEAVKN